MIGLNGKGLAVLIVASICGFALIVIGVICICRKCRQTDKNGQPQEQPNVNIMVNIR